MSNSGPANSSTVNLQPIMGSFDNNGNILQLYGANGVPLTLNGMTGVTDGSNSAAGQVGEFVTSQVLIASAVSLTTDTPKNVTSISLTAGDWNVYGFVGFAPAASTSLTHTSGSISQVTNTLDVTAQQALTTPAIVPGATLEWSNTLPEARISLTATTTIYLVAHAIFTVSTLGAYGTISARRMR